MMQGIEYKKLSESPQVARAQAQRAEAATSDVGEKLEQIREEIAKDPQSVFKYITISPVKKKTETLLVIEYHLVVMPHYLMM